MQNIHCQNSDYLSKYGKKYFRSNEHIKNMEYVNKEKILNIYELMPSTQKSYYGKAKVIITENGSYLLSYNTIVCGMVNNKFYKYWDAYSVTTMNHINDFLWEIGLNIYGGKKWWNGLQVNHGYSLEDMKQ